MSENNKQFQNQLVRESAISLYSSFSSLNASDLSEDSRTFAMAISLISDALKGVYYRSQCNLDNAELLQNLKKTSDSLNELSKKI